MIPSRGSVVSIALILHRKRRTERLKTQRKQGQARQVQSRALRVQTLLCGAYSRHFCGRQGER